MTTRNPLAASSKPGPKKQPMRVPTGAGYGEADKMKKQQKAAPMAAGGAATPPPPGRGAPQGQGAPQGMPVERDLFRPSEVPGGPVAGDEATSPAQIIKENPQLALRIMYSQFPTPALAALIRRTGSRG